MKNLYRVILITEKGNEIRFFGLFEAEDSFNAKQIASRHFDDDDIANKNEYRAEYTTFEKIIDLRERYMKRMLRETTILNRVSTGLVTT